MCCLVGTRRNVCSGQDVSRSRLPAVRINASSTGHSVAEPSFLSKHVDLPTLDEHARMAHGLTPEAVGRWVTALLDQRGRRCRVETTEICGHALIAITMFVFALVLAFAGPLFPLAQFGPPVWLLLFSTLLGGYRAPAPPQLTAPHGATRIRTHGLTETPRHSRGRRTGPWHQCRHLGRNHRSA
jgi:hypothetical protein